MTEAARLDIELPTFNHSTPNDSFMCSILQVVDKYRYVDGHGDEVVVNIGGGTTVCGNGGVVGISPRKSVTFLDEIQQIRTKNPPTDDANENEVDHINKNLPHNIYFEPYNISGLCILFN